MERGDKVDFVRKPRTFAMRKPRSGGSHTFINDHDSSSPSGSPQNDVDEGGKYTNFTLSRDDPRRKLGSSGNNNNKGRFEMGNEEMGRSKSGFRRVRGAGDDDWGAEKDEAKRIRKDAAEFGSIKHRSPEDDRNCERKHERTWGSGIPKLQDYDRNRASENKPSREKNLRDENGIVGDSKENLMEKADKERRFNGETFKRKKFDDLDRLKGERKDSYDRRGNHEKSDWDRDRERNHGSAMQGHRLGASSGRINDDQGNSKSGDGSVHRASVVGLGAGGGSADCRNSDARKGLERKSSDSHAMSQPKGVDAPGVGHARLPDGGKKATNPEGSVRETSDFAPAQENRCPKVKVKLGGVAHNLHNNLANYGSVSKQRSVLGSDAPATHLQAAESGKRRHRLILQDNSDDEDDYPPRMESFKKEASITDRPNVPKMDTNQLREERRSKLAEDRPFGKWADFNQSREERRSKFAEDRPSGKRADINQLREERKSKVVENPPFAKHFDINQSKEERRIKFADDNLFGKQFNINQSNEERKNKFAEGRPFGKRADMPNNFVVAQPVRKSSRIPKKRVFDGELDDDEDIEEATQRKISRASKKRVHDGEYDDGREDEEIPQPKISKVPKKQRMLEVEYYEDAVELGSQRYRKKQKKQRSGRASESMLDEDDEEEAPSDDEDIENSDNQPDGRKRNKRKDGALNSINEVKKEVPLTTRQRAMQSSKDADADVGVNLIEFPDGLPQSGSKKKKEKLSEVEIQLKKAEAAQRRKQQVERNANAIQAEAIKKILGQDSSRKKREDKQRKQRDEKEQEKAASAMMLASNSIRWVMGPNGTVVSFPQETGLPSIFNSAPCRYPPAREKCAGPLCNNTYKYRDSKSNLPLCSLQCYREIHNATHTVTTC